MESIFPVVREPDRIRVVLYSLVLTLFQGSQTAEEQRLRASSWHALTQRSKVERQLPLHANLNSLGQVVSKRDTLGVARSQDSVISSWLMSYLLSQPAFQSSKSLQKATLSRRSHQTSNHATYRHG